MPSALIANTDIIRVLACLALDFAAPREAAVAILLPANLSSLPATAAAQQFTTIDAQ